MGDQNCERVVPESIDAPLKPLAVQAEARTRTPIVGFATVVCDSRGVPAEAPAIPAEAPAVQAEAPAIPAHPPAIPAQAPAIPAQAPAIPAQAPAVPAQAPAAPNIDMDADERDTFAYKQVANLHDINENYPIHKLALEHWQSRQEYLSNIVSRREGQGYELTNQIYTIFGWFAVFQGVLLTAVSQLTQSEEGVPLCGKIWSPIVLAVFATVATIVGILQKFASLQKLNKRIHSDRQIENELTKRATNLLREGRPGFNFKSHTDDTSAATEPKSLKECSWVIGFVVIFACFCILFYFVILCDTGVIREWDGGLHG